MTSAFPGATIDAPKDGVYDYDIIDPNDGHVAHAAILGKADAIMTEDRRAGFRTSTKLIAADIEIASPAEFAANTVAAHPAAAARAVRSIARRIKLSAMSQLQVVGRAQEPLSDD